MRPPIALKSRLGGPVEATSVDQALTSLNEPGEWRATEATNTKQPMARPYGGVKAVVTQPV